MALSLLLRAAAGLGGELDDAGWDEDTSPYQLQEQAVPQHSLLDSIVIWILMNPSEFAFGCVCLLLPLVLLSGCSAYVMMRELAQEERKAERQKKQAQKAVIKGGGGGKTPKAVTAAAATPAASAASTSSTPAAAAGAEGVTRRANAPASSKR